MKTQHGGGSRRHHRARHGFTLIELMIAVAIVGILATLAIPTFGSYILKSRATEAPQFIGLIKLRQEAYRSEFGRYAEASGAGLTMANIQNNLQPALATLGSAKQPFTGGPIGWNDLGAVPAGQVYFGYGMAAGNPSTAPAAAGYGPGTEDYWYVIQAWGDLDGDGDLVMFEAYEPTVGIFIDCSGLPCSYE